MVKFVYVVFEPYKEELIAVYDDEVMAKEVVMVANRNTGESNCSIKYVKMEIKNLKVKE